MTGEVEIGYLGRLKVDMRDEGQEKELEHQKSSRDIEGKYGRHADACGCDDVLRQVSRTSWKSASTASLVAVTLTLTASMFLEFMQGKMSN